MADQDRPRRNAYAVPTPSETDQEDDFWDRAQPHEPRHVMRDAFGFICLLGAFLLFLLVTAPALGALFQSVF